MPSRIHAAHVILRVLRAHGTVCSTDGFRCANSWPARVGFLGRQRSKSARHRCPRHYESLPVPHSKQPHLIMILDVDKPAFFLSDFFPADRVEPCLILILVTSRIWRVWN